VIGDIQRLLVDSLWLWAGFGSLYWGFVGFVVASRLGSSALAGVCFGAAGWAVGLLVVVLWAKSRPSRNAAVERVSTPRVSVARRPRRPSSSWGGEDWNEPAQHSWGAPSGGPAGSFGDAPGGSTRIERERDSAGFAVAAGTVVGLGAAALLATALFFSWVDVAASGLLSADLRGSGSPWTALPLLASSATLAGCVAGFLRTRQRRWTVIAATVSVPWLYTGVAVAMSAGALDTIARSLTTTFADLQADLPAGVPADASLDRGNGLTLLIAGGALGMMWAIWMSTLRRRDPRPAPALDVLPASAGWTAAPSAGLDEDW